MLSPVAAFGQGPDFGVKYIQTRMLNIPVDNYKDMRGWGFTLESRYDYRAFVPSLDVSLIGYRNNSFERTLNVADNRKVELGCSTFIPSLMYGYAYYPIQRRAILNPYARAYLGIAGHRPSVYARDPDFLDYMQIDYSQANRKARVSAAGRLGLGLEVNLSNISAWDRYSSFSLFCTSSINFLTQANIIDINDMQGGNQTFSNVTHLETESKHAVQIGKLRQYYPTFVTTEFGFIFRLLDMY